MHRRRRHGPMRTALLPCVVVLAGLAQAADAAIAPGAALYAANCSMCHQAEGVGQAGQYPRLKGRIDRIAATPAGRHYLADVLAYGLGIHIVADGASYTGIMPPIRQLSDADAASVLSWLSGLGDSRPPPVISAAEVASVRGRRLSISDVEKERTALAATRPLP